MEYKDYYDIMGVEREASQDEIKRAYRKLARIEKLQAQLRRRR